MLADNLKSDIDAVERRKSEGAERWQATEKSAAREKWANLRDGPHFFKFHSESAKLLLTFATDCI